MKSLSIGSAIVLLVLVAASESAKTESTIFGPQPMQYPMPATSTFIVSDFLQFLQTAVTCFNKLRIPEERFPLYLAGVFPNCPETQCFVRCLSANLNLYCDETGSDIDRHYLQYGLGQDYNCFRQKAEQCLAANTSPCNDPCEAAYKQELCFLEEFRKYVDSNMNSLIAAVAVEKTENNPVYYNMNCRLASALAPFGTRDPPPGPLREAQTACVKYLGICKTRLVQYNNSIYPTDHDTMCMVRCAGIIVGFWDDSQGFKLEGLMQLYPQLAADSRAQQQILSCAEQRIATCPPPDTCAKAYNAFRCFLDAQKHGFGVREPQPEEPMSTVVDAQEFMRSISICSKIQRIPKNLQDLYLQGVFPNDEKTRGFMRCFGIRTELYDDMQGPNISRLYRLFGTGQSETEFRRKAELCIKANQPLLDGQDKNVKAYRTLYLCFSKQITAFIRANANAMP
uniref:Uncharacterized protein n=1 Tax=Anopheles minimus TaxID=112268 RepID=A0A182VYC8_9DIPT